MSADNIEEADNTSARCASCGVTENDDIKLKNCTACYLVRYCGVKCQRDHRPQHKKDCKKRAAELRDEILFKQPESSSFGDCPICCLPLPLDTQKFCLMSCCSKRVCDGCNVANQKREVEMRLQRSCPFCRTPVAKTEEEGIERLIKRVEVNDPVALRTLGARRRLEGDYKRAFECWTKAAELGDVESHHNLAVMYQHGHGVSMDEKKEVHHFEKAAIGGYPDARFNLGVIEEDYGRYERAVKHFIIAAYLGCDKSLEALKDMYQKGKVSKEDFSAALRAYQVAVGATKSPQREEAEEYYSK